MVSKPDGNPWVNIDPEETYLNCENMFTNLNSHQMKNSEWGAASYLAYSSYGRNGNIKTENEGSTTGNIYGIYDMLDYER